MQSKKTAYRTQRAYSEAARVWRREGGRRTAGRQNTFLDDGVGEPGL